MDGAALKDLADYFDSNGFIGHKWEGRPGQLEFGDGCQRISMFYFLSLLLAKSLAEKVVLIRRWQSIWPMMKLESGEFTRHWNRSMWWGQERQMSRDQLIPLLCCFAITKNEEIISIGNALKKRFGFTWNTLSIWPKPDDGWKPPDWAGPCVWAIIMRGKLARGDYGPISKCFVSLVGLPLLDTFLVLNSLARIISPLIAPNHTSADKAHFLTLLLAKKMTPTLFSELSILIYKFRPKGPEWAFKQYFLDEKAPPLDIVMCRAYQEVLVEPN